MAPAVPGDFYKVYKEDIDSVAAWLGSTAKARGFPAAKLTSKTWDVPRIKPIGGRLKGKERKEASETAKLAPYLLAVDDFVPLASFIAQCEKPSISVPDAFFQVVDRIICTRSRFSGFVHSLGGKHDTHADTKHGHFARVLERVRNLLRTRMTVSPSPSPKGKTQAKTHASSELFTDPVSALSITVPSYAFLDPYLTSVERPKAQPGDITNYEAEPVCSYEDIVFIFELLFHSIDQIRTNISKLWARKQDVAATAVATNTGIGLARSMIEEVESILDLHDGGIVDILSTFYHMRCAKTGHDVIEAMKSGCNMLNGELYEVASRSLYSTYNIVCTFVRQVSGPGISLYGGKAYEYDAKSNRATKSGLEKFDEDSFLLRECCTERSAIIRGLGDYPVEDELLMGMKELHKTRKVSMILIFTAQIYLDINHVLRDEARVIFEKAKSEGQVIKGHCDDFVKQFRKMCGPDEVFPHDDMVKHLNIWIDLVNNDRICEIQVTAYQNSKVPVPGYLVPNRTFTHSPIMTGLWLSHLRAVNHKLGMLVMNRWGTIVSCAHIYNAMQQAELLKPHWLDMEVFINLLGTSSIWIGGERPESMEDCFQRWCVQRGTTAAMILGKRRALPADIHLTHRLIKQEPPGWYQFDDILSHKNIYIIWTPETLEAVVEKMENKKVTMTEFALKTELGLMTTRMNNPKELNGAKPTPKKKKDPLALKMEKKTAKRTSVQLMVALANGLNEEAKVMVFPFTVLHRECWTLLQKINKRCSPLLMSMYGPGYLKSESNLAELASYFMANASGNKPGLADMRHLKSASITMEKMLGSGRGKVATTFTRELGKKLSHGNIELIEPRIIERSKTKNDKKKEDCEEQ